MALSPCPVLQVLAATLHQVLSLANDGIGYMIMILVLLHNFSHDGIGSDIVS